MSVSCTNGPYKKLCEKVIVKHTRGLKFKFDKRGSVNFYLETPTRHAADWGPPLHTHTEAHLYGMKSSPESPEGPLKVRKKVHKVRALRPHRDPDP